MPTKKEWLARAEAYREASEHLELAWTDDKLERQQGNIVSVRLKGLYEKCLDRAQ